MKPATSHTNRHIWLVLLAWVTAHAATANDLMEFYQLALTRDATLQAARFQRDATVEAQPQALSQLLPQVNAVASATRQHVNFLGQTDILIQNCTQANATTDRCFGSVHGYGLTLSQTIWSFESLSRLSEARFQAASAQAALADAEQTLLLRVAQAYFGILAAEDQLDTNRRERDSFGTLLNQAKVREHSGVGRSSDVEQAQYFYDATEQSVVEAENALDDAYLALDEITGAHAHEVTPLRADIPLAAPDPASVDTWVAVALDGNPTVRTYRLQAVAAEKDISVQRGKGLPTLVLGGTSSRTSQDQWLGGNQTLDTVSLSFNWPLFQGGAVASAVRQSRALYRQADALYVSKQRDIERQTRAAYRGVVNGIRLISAARRAVDSGAVAVEASRRNVEFDTGTEFDLLNAQNNYYAATRAYSQTRYDYLTATLALKQLAGTLAIGDLEKIDKFLVTRQTDHEHTNFE
jgi:outer membrane protein